MCDGVYNMSCMLCELCAGKVFCNRGVVLQQAEVVRQGVTVVYHNTLGCIVTDKGLRAEAIGHNTQSVS